MKGIKGFNPRRFFLLIRNSIFLERSLILIVSAAIGGIVILLSLRSAVNLPGPGFYPKYYFLTLYIGGLILAGGIFKKLHHENMGAAWLVLPASIFEKFTSRLVITAAVFPVGIMALFFFISLISEGINRLLIGAGHDLFNPFDRIILLQTLSYCIFQSIFLLGGVYFKRYAAIKTVLGLLIYSFIIIAVFGISAKYMFSGGILDFLSMSAHVREMTRLFIENQALEQILSVIKWTIYIGYWYVLAPLCWVTGYFRLKEKEI